MIKSNKGRWYIKQGESVQGPFPNKLIGSYLILGRMTQETLVSQDKNNWAPVKNYPAIVPEVVKESGTPQGDRALMLARIREDERSSQAEAEDQLNASRDDRRDDEEQLMQLHRQIRDDVLKRHNAQPKKQLVYLSLIVLVVFTVVGIYLSSLSDDDTRLADCNAKALPGINWSGCNKQGELLRSRDLTKVNFRSAKLSSIDLSNSRLVEADLAYANLSQAILVAAQLQKSNMKGTNLRQANLQQANLSGANLSYAELVGAKLQDANLSRAIFDHAIWVNGEQCMVGSVGACLLPANE